MKLKQYQYNILLFFIVALWGSLYIGNKVLLSHMPVLVLLFFRCAIAAAVLIPVTHIMRFKPIERGDWGRMVVVGIVGYFGSNALLTMCTQLTSASLASLLNSTNPVFMILFAYFMLGEAITVKKVVVVAMAIAGAVVIIGGPGSGVNLLGVGCAVLSVIMWSFNVIYMKCLTRKYHPLTVTAYGMGIAALVCLPTGFASLKLTQTVLSFDAVTILWLLYVSLVCTAFAHMMWNWCLSRQDAGHCAAFYPVQPMVSMLLGFALLGENMTASFLAGSLLILVSVALNSLPEKKTTKEIK